jgi:hypothetical protein
MVREILLRQLAQAERRVAEGKAFISKQQRLIVESERDGHDAAETLRLLETFLHPAIARSTALEFSMSCLSRLNR